MADKEYNFLDSQESMEIEEIEDSFMNLEIENKITEIKQLLLENIEHQAETGDNTAPETSNNSPENTSSTLTGKSRNDNIQTQQSKSQQEDFDFTGSLIGYTAETLDEIHEIYKKHAFAMGFGVRQSPTRWTQGDNKQIRGKDFVCNQEGFRCKPKIMKTPPLANENKKKTKQVPITRTGCKALIRAKKNKEGKFEIEEHIINHNHELTRKVWQHLHRSERKITEDKAKVIDLMAEIGLKPIEAYNLMTKEAGGEELLGHTLRDNLNYISRRKIKEIEGGDAQTVIYSLYQTQAKEEDFFFRFKLGGDENTNKLTGIFWRDSEMKEDYHIYGDVTIFDTTYKTNKYNLICSPIVGVNNHWQTVMFGCAFIADEKIDTFDWVLSTFKKSMGRREPATIFRDQDFAMSKAIEKRSESTNNAVGFKANKNTSLTEFFRIFKQTVKRWRKNEADADFKCSNSEPTSHLPMYGLLKHASEIYTHTIFKYFEAEFSYSMGCITFLHNQIGDHYFYEVQIENEISSRQKVTFSSSQNRIACSCKNYE
ncbi:protein FAR1-RELATED SEQUENCE 5-like [Chenopodium quinoa]|uniref:protein FAR1-RELATED SEQUENCE 5-like n=1 Tax=Chenopodium quinoa TaxID=63459 RepID=UPI000B76BF50|nr:protein FAR1-RELATED SEQUENCE 5-like [Chenopodium quinoa]